MLEPALAEDRWNLIDTTGGEPFLSSVREDSVEAALKASSPKSVLNESSDSFEVLGNDDEPRV